ncbi:hypothetical protein EHI8A_075840 [Entamoeba histolytica HM-1:IMSS-B]|uniref:Uncharacterized protein n=6 Tax=Entamoeba histolytica TaxID=5759 RepID=C4LVE6_ENTH1|nr:hypothetical protein EHI_197290 [Entamoeba histolytica HM-1:IMSS]EMD43450.1 Hypothetical protein EHI5A_112200 [Entamoeba histolytica KU27]EMH77442.1 hypothetical protein EHI8A_075840 [Entamoeba histolytica HM-1:IMSS-B]EMS16112.1 hypothetical protein KM1_025280 [Entamoeba histolytica HM-3:IMSS]ENY63051.1 hypothetical protein EHI7A_073990 [Entamoeba histolytica HM-1:IMSS-A]GAT92635.1 hypothetical protein CL6EHI_197290 [Entamoeba histolytica]|eukprot:XP_653988.1 hypothetical protein EHI_197290 [Entamoeba histolytica HM-1:IMSS]
MKEIIERITLGKGNDEDYQLLKQNIKSDIIGFQKEGGFEMIRNKTNDTKINNTEKIQIISLLEELCKGCNIIQNLEIYKGIIPFKWLKEEENEEIIMSILNCGYLLLQLEDTVIYYKENEILKDIYQISNYKNGKLLYKVMEYLELYCSKETEIYLVEILDNRGVDVLKKTLDYYLSESSDDLKQKLIEKTWFVIDVFTSIQNIAEGFIKCGIIQKVIQCYDSISNKTIQKQIYWKLISLSSILPNELILELYTPKENCIPLTTVEADDPEMIKLYLTTILKIFIAGDEIDQQKNPFLPIFYHHQFVSVLEKYIPSEDKEISKFASYLLTLYFLGNDKNLIQ